MKFITKHFLLLDFLRIFAVLIIAPYYLDDFSLYRPLEGSSFVGVSSLLQAMKFFSFSGFILVFLVFFLIGFKKKRKTFFPVLVQVFLGFFALSLFAGYNFFQWSFHWDTYHFIILSLLVVFIMNHFSVSFKVLIVLGVVLLWIPFWNFSIFYTNSFVQEALIGVCKEGISRGTWPLLPWIGLVFLAYGLGFYYNINQKILSQIPVKKLLLWIFVVVLCLLFWGGYSHLVFGAQANCFLHRQDPWIFWVHFIVFLFFVRLAFLQKIQCFLARYRFFILLEKLSWSTHFGLSFIIFLLMNALFGQYFYSLLEQDNLYLLLISWSSVILTHFAVRVILFIKKKFLLNSD